MFSFKPGKNDIGENVFSKIEQIETEFENLKVGENIQYFFWLHSLLRRYMQMTLSTKSR